MKIITRKNKKLYKYEKRSITFNIKTAIVFFVIAIVLFMIDVLICYAFLGDAPTVVGGIGICAILMNILSTAFIIVDIYAHKNFQPAIRNMLALQLLYFIMWIIII